jgi:periplasmic divalent cation tolerance protein
MNRTKRPPRPRPAVVILAAYPGRPPALRAARALVREGTLACATVHPGATAVYRWKGRRYEEPSTLLWGKTTAAMADRAIRTIRTLHPDEVAEILVLRVAKGNARYLDWVARSVGPQP